MGEQDPTYHPSVEKLVETSGVDIGRVKDMATAEYLASQEKRYHDGGIMVKDSDGKLVNPTQEEINVDVDNYLTSAVARDAAIDSEAMKSMAHDAGLDAKYGVNRGTEKADQQRLAEKYAESVEAGKEGIKSLDALLSVSKAENQRQETRRVKDQLAEARRKIAEHVAKSE